MREQRCVEIRLMAGNGCERSFKIDPVEQRMDWLAAD